jgi:hypothetical protein
LLRRWRRRLSALEHHSDDNRYGDQYEGEQQAIHRQRTVVVAPATVVVDEGGAVVVGATVVVVSGTVSSDRIPIDSATA